MIVGCWMNPSTMLEMNGPCCSLFTGETAQELVYMQSNITRWTASSLLLLYLRVQQFTFFFTIWTPLLHDLFKTDVCTVCTQEFSSVGISTEFNTHIEFKQVETLNRAKGSFVQLFPSESFITFHLKKRNIHSEKGHFLFAVRYNL